MRKVAPQDAEKVREELSRSKSESGDQQLRNNVRILVERANQFDKYQPMLDELLNVKNVIEEKQRANPQGQCPPAQGLPAQGGLIPQAAMEVLRFIAPWLQPPDQLSQLAMEAIRSSIDFTKTVQGAIVSKIGGFEKGPEAK
jgi:hypothetical protein